MREPIDQEPKKLETHEAARLHVDVDVFGGISPRAFHLRT